MSKEEKAYQTFQIWIKPGHRLFPYFQHACQQAKNLHNTTNFFIRQVYTAMQQTGELQLLQKEVLDLLYENIEQINNVQLAAYQKRLAREQAKPVQEQKAIKPNLYVLPTKEASMLSYGFLDALFKGIKQENYRSLPTQSSQQVMKEVFKNWKSFFASIKAYKKNPALFTGRPSIPKYCRSSQKKVTFTNQDCVIKEGKYLKLPLSNHRLNIGKLGATHQKLMEVRVIPAYGRYVVELVCSSETAEVRMTAKHVMGIDLGVNNLATIVTNSGKKPQLIKGKVVKSINQFYNKQKAHYVSILRQGKDQKEGPYTSKRLERLHRKRFLKIKDFFHKASHQIVKMALEENVGTIVIGQNKQWKSASTMGKRNNQSFSHIPHALLIQMISYKAKRKGINVIAREESYTSKASFLDRDDIPTYGERNQASLFSGVRMKRGLYRSKDGTLLNADVNGAYNILRKEVPTAFMTNGIEGLDSLKAVAVSTPLVLIVR